jgi:hypothetical protein
MLLDASAGAISGKGGVPGEFPAVEGDADE